MLLDVVLNIDNRIMGLYRIHSIYKSDNRTFIPGNRINKGVQLTSARTGGQNTIV